MRNQSSLVSRNAAVAAIGGGVLVSMAVLASDALIGPPGRLTGVGLWPVSVLLWLVGPGVPIGATGSARAAYEWTPVQDFAVAVGVGLSWTFYVFLGALLIGLTRRRRSTHIP